MRYALLVVLIAGCSKLANPADVTYAGAPVDDAATATDAMVAQFDCPTYCSTIAANCTGIYAQYAGGSDADITAHCMGTCAKFAGGMLGDTSGNTLGCRLFHAGAARFSAPIHCPLAGPAGDRLLGHGVCGSPCLSFCTLEIAACGVTGVDPSGQYSDLSSCMAACASFDVTHPYLIDATVLPTVTPVGNSLACRLFHTTNALLSPPATAIIHCPHTQAIPMGVANPCAGTAAP
jgi:hypothetical protein